jgi:hypothetical protein
MLHHIVLGLQSLRVDLTLSGHTGAKLCIRMGCRNEGISASTKFPGYFSFCNFIQFDMKELNRMLQNVALDSLKGQV